MNIKFDKTDAVSGVLTINLVEADYAAQVKKSLNEFCKKAKMPGFRPGMVPMGLAKKMYGTEAKAQAVNNVLSDALMGYIRDYKLPILGEPMNNEAQQPQDIENGSEFEFIFDIALAPEFQVALDSKDTVAYYDIQVSDEMIQQQVDAFAQRGGHNENVDSYQDRDIVRGTLTELDAKGHKKRNGLVVEAASVMPTYFKNDEQKALFAEAKQGGEVIFNPTTAYDGNATELASLLKVEKETVESHTGDFKLEVEEISRYVAAPVDQALFDQIYGEGTVKSEEEFRLKIKEGIQQQFSADSDYMFLQTVRKHIEEKVGTLQFPEAILRRFMWEQNKEREGFTEEKFNEEFPKSLDELRWHLIREQLVEQNQVKVDDADVKAAALEATRFQFMQYGINNIPDEYLEQYAQEMLKKRDQVNNLVDHVINRKLTLALKNVVTLDHKSVTTDEFSALVKE